MGNIMSVILRKKILKKLAQAAPTVPASSTAAPSVINATPPSFIASNWYPGIIVAFQPKNTNLINSLSNLVNNALFYSSDGEVYLQWMRSVNFTFGTDQSQSVDLKNLMQFSKLLYNTLFTNMGQAYLKQLEPEEVKEKIDHLSQSPQLNNLSQTGTQLSTKIGGNLKELIKNNLLQIH